MSVSPVNKRGRVREPFTRQELHPAWVALIRYCRDLGHGEIARLKVQDGVPVMAEEIMKKVKLV